MHFMLRSLYRQTRSSVRTFSTAVEIKPSEEKWDLFAGVSLERLPIITRDLNKTEQNFFNILAEVEFENSHKSKFEIRLENDLKRAKQLKEGAIDNIEIDSLPQQTGQDFLDACQQELKAFKFSPRRADDETEKNLKSNRRALDKRLLLLINENVGEKNVWILPQGIYKGEESLRLTAERVLQEKCGSDIHARFLGNCPCGFYKYKYPKPARKDSVGAKIFFFKAQLLKGQVDEKMCKEFQWATRREIAILPEDYCKIIKKFLIDEEH